MRPVQRVSYEPLPLWMRAKVAWTKLRTGHEGHTFYTLTWHVPVNEILDGGLRREMLDFARGMYHYELPPGDAVILTGMLDGPGAGGALHLFGWLRAALAAISGEESSAIAAPTGQSGDEDGSFGLHADMWIPALLFNVFNHVVAAQGASLLLPMDEMWGIAAAAGVPADVRAEMAEARVEAGECDYFEQFNGLLYGDHPWTDRVRRALREAAIEVPLGPGQGYFVNDREWLHGRTELAPDALPRELKEDRLYRLAYNNARLDAAAGKRRVEWEWTGRHAAGCKS
ncbi:hypothetical protein [Candidatus Solirubrobacter pratensis]|uniref:hypothetical protein n=1 Tax=Candidatus Solirubrobacter pratensis TaxID=1298857 RepID=UPI0004037767|nr:hypothetical protein [Candidatus Solirubrobacter pratensis]